MTDEVKFDVPLALLAGAFVRRDVEKIFAFRREALLKRFAR